MATTQITDGDPKLKARQKVLQAGGYYHGRIDGFMGSKTRAAEAAYAKAKPATSAFNPLSLTQSPDAAAAEAAAYGSYQNGINRPAEDLTLNARSASDPAQALGNVGLNTLADGKIDPAKTGTAYVAPAASPEGPTALSTGIGMVTDIGRAVSGAIGASQPLPKYQEDPVITAERERLHAQSLNGMTSGEMGRLQQATREQQAAQQESIRQTLGGGSSQATALAAQLAHQQGQTDAQLGITDANHQRQLQGQALYDQALNAKQGVDYAGYQTNYANTLQSRNAYAAATQANLQHLADGSEYRRTQPMTQAYMDALKTATLEAGGAGGMGLVGGGLHPLSALMTDPRLRKYLMGAVAAVPATTTTPATL